MNICLLHTTADKLLRIKNRLEDYNNLEGKIPIYCDNNVSISLCKNPTLHSCVKHVEVKYPFIRDHVNKGIVDLKYVSIKDELANIFTKPLIEDGLHRLITLISMRNIE